MLPRKREMRLKLRNDELENSWLAFGLFDGDESLADIVYRRFEVELDVRYACRRSASLIATIKRQVKITSKMHGTV